MNVMRSFTLRSLKRNKKRTIVTILGVVISVAMITGVSVLVSSFISFLQRGTIADTGNWHAQLTHIPAGNRDALAADSRVGDAVLSYTRGFSPIENAEGYSRQYFYLREYSPQGYEQMKIRLLEGRLPQKPGEILISQSILQGSSLAYALGDTLALTVGDILSPKGERMADNGYLPYSYDDRGLIVDSPTFEPTGSVSLTVVGVMETPYFERGSSAGYALLGYLDPNSLAADDPVDAYVTMSHLSRGIYQDVEGLAAAYGGEETDTTLNDELLRYYGVVEWDNIYAFLQGFSLILLLIIVVASVSLIYNAFSMSVSERARQLGLLASVGATRRQKRASVYFEGLFIGAIGIPIGILAGIGGIGVTLTAIQPLMDSMLGAFNDIRLTLVLPLWAIGLAVLFSAITIFVSVYRPARRASKISPIDAIRQTQETRLSRRSVSTSRLMRLLFGFEGELALKNLKRSRRKYRATVISLVIALVLFLTVSSYADITGSVSDSIRDGYNYDIALRYGGASENQIEDVNARIAALDTVNQFSPQSKLHGYTYLAAGQIGEYAKEFIAQPEDASASQFELSIALVGLDEASFEAYAKAIGVRAEDYADEQNPRTILINYATDYAYAEGNNVRKVAGDVLEVKAGDKLTCFAGSPGMMEEASAAFTLGAITPERPMGVMTGSFSSVTLVVTSRVWNATVAALPVDAMQQLPEGYIDRYAYITTDEDQRLAAQIKELVQGMPAVDIFNMKDMARSERNVNIFLGVFVYGFITLISLICIANIINTVSTNIGLRRRELAMLRSVGMTQRGFNRMMRFESLFYGLKGLMWGIPISLLIALLLYNMQTDVLGMNFRLPWISYLVAVFMILVIVLATMAYSTHRMKKENIIDALKREIY